MLLFFASKSTNKVNRKLKVFRFNNKVWKKILFKGKMKLKIKVLTLTDRKKNVPGLLDAIYKRGRNVFICV